MPKEFIIYCDESSSKEKHFSDFYGGVLVNSDDIDFVRAALSDKKRELNLHGELKWTKITENYEDKYKQIVDAFFDLVDAGKIKVRIMFTHNIFSATPLSRTYVDNKYFMLYYQFIKHAFGLTYATDISSPVSLRIYLDKLPDTKEKVEEFRNYLVIMTRSADYRGSGIRLKKEDIAEINSHDHDILQCLDIVLGSINFRLNDKHKEKPPGQYRRGKRTVAKERVYRHINARIQKIYPYFNIGISTGTAGDLSNRWGHAYRHWKFVASNSVLVGTSKRKK
ncbi:hypothetical protein FHR71_004491 [Methylobacterium sp. RAS18]|nr:hypothetical protein [Methylobacterium sp. RAS18]